MVFMNSVRSNFFTDLQLPVLSDPKRAACFVLATYAKVPLFLRKTSKYLHRLILLLRPRQPEDKKIPNPIPIFQIFRLFLSEPLLQYNMRAIFVKGLSQCTTRGGDSHTLPI